MVALVVQARRTTLLRRHGRRLRHEDLEDCFGQAALELVARAREGAPFNGTAHVAYLLEQRFLSRVHDRRRALAGRSDTQAIFEDALATGLFSEEEPQVIDPRAEPERIVEGRLELQRLSDLACKLSEEQQLVLACQTSLQWGSKEFCERFGWTPAKYRKVGQRARARLRLLADLCPTEATKSD